MPKKLPVLLTDQIRGAIDQSGLTRYRISKETGISESTLSKFYLKQRGLSMDALNALAECLQITIHVGRKAEPEGK
jgi:transcriptional regulator with XRE-family HTH domain